MAATYLKTQKTQLFKVSGTTTSVEIVNLTDFNPPSSTADEIEITNLMSDAKEFVQGLIDNGEATFNINWVPTEASHIELNNDFEAGTTREYLIGLSDGTTAAPTVASSAFGTPATTRSWIKFSGFVKAIPPTGSTNDVAKAQVTIRATGPRVIYEKV